MNKIGWIGLGAMGVPMVRNLATKGYNVTAYNRSDRELAISPATVASSLKDAVLSADVVIVMVSDGQAVRDVLFGQHGAASFLCQGTLVVNMSTIGVDETEQIALELSDMGMDFMDAPVSGSVKPAEDGTLVILAGGSDASFQRMQPAFAAMGKKAYHVGPVGSGAAMKLMVNAFLAMTVEAASECMAIADKSGVGRGQFLQVLSETGMWSPILAAKRNLWEQREYSPAFALKHMTKDAGLMATYASQLSAGMPALQVVLAMYLSARANGLAEKDMAAVAETLTQLVGNA